MKDSNILNKLKSYCKYADITMDKEFALELVPLVERVITDTSALERLSRMEHRWTEKLLFDKCEKHGIITKWHAEINEKHSNKIKLKTLRLLEALYDIITEDTPAWERKWNIKDCHELEYDEVKKKQCGLEYTVWTVKPEYKHLEKENKKIISHNSKQRSKCQKWRDSYLGFYKEILRSINN